MRNMKKISFPNTLRWIIKPMATRWWRQWRNVGSGASRTGDDPGQLPLLVPSFKMHLSFVPVTSLLGLFKIVNCLSRRNSKDGAPTRYWAGWVQRALHPEKQGSWQVSHPITCHSVRVGSLTAQCSYPRSPHSLHVFSSTATPTLWSTKPCESDDQRGISRKK